MAYLFEAKGKLLIKSNATDEKLYDVAIENGADDINDIDGGKTEIV